MFCCGIKFLKPMSDFSVEKLMVNDELGHLLAKILPFFVAGRARNSAAFRVSGSTGWTGAGFALKFSGDCKTKSSRWRCNVAVDRKI
jgi:hypothetical protein